MHEFYVSFGQDHAHVLQPSRQLVGPDHIVVIKADNYGVAHDTAMEVFGGRFCTVYDTKPDMNYYPGGLVPLDPYA